MLIDEAIQRAHRRREGDGPKRGEWEDGPEGQLGVELHASVVIEPAHLADGHGGGGVVVVVIVVAAHTQSR